MLVQKGALAGALRHLVRFVPAKPSIPALGHVRLQADGQTLTIDASDGRSSHVRVQIPADGSTLATCLPVRILLDFVRPSATDKGAEVEFKVVEGDRVVVAVDGSMAELQALSIDDLAQSPGQKASEWSNAGGWDAVKFSRMVAWTILAAGRDETRPQLTGVHFGEREVVATDGHRLHRAPLGGIQGGPTLVQGSAVAALLDVLPKKSPHNHLPITFKGTNTLVIAPFRS